MISLVNTYYKKFDLAVHADYGVDPLSMFQHASMEKPNTGFYIGAFK